MRRTGVFETIFAAALASVMGLGAADAAALAHGPESYEAGDTSGTVLPVWLLRYKLRQQGYQDIAAVRPAETGFVVDARDRWGRTVRLLVDRASGEILPGDGFGMRHLARADVADLLEQHGLALCSPIVRSEDRYEMKALDGAGRLCTVGVDPLTGTMWY